MSEQQWTPEPWAIKYEYNVFGRNGERHTASCGSTSSNIRAEQTDIENVANAARIVQCVNAMKGIDDPAAMVAHHDETMRLLGLIRITDLESCPCKVSMWEAIQRCIANAKAAKGGK